MSLTANVAGLTFRFKDDPTIQQLRPSGPVKLVAEPENKYDPMAIKVMLGDKHIGYIPKDHPVQAWFHEAAANAEALTAEVVDYSYFDKSQPKGCEFNQEHVGRLGSVTIRVFGADESHDAVPSESSGPVVSETSYAVAGKKYARCTTVTGAFNPDGMERLIKWAFQFGSFEAYKAELGEMADEGKANHANIEKYLKGDTSVDIPVGARNFIDKYKPITVATESTVYDDESMTAGTFDLLCMIDGVLTIVDWKRSKAVRSSMLMQGSFYATMKEAKQVMIVALGADNVQGYSLKKIDAEKIEEEYAKFCLLRELMRLHQGW